MADHPADPSRLPAPADPHWPLIAGAAVLAALLIGWVGYTASDDAAYYQAALEWLHHAPVAGADHWATRFPLVLSFAAALALLRDPPLAMAITALAWYAAFLAIAFDLARRIAGSRAGWIAVILLATLPVVVAQATTVSCDLAEAGLLLLGIRWAGDGADGRRAAGRAIAAGIAFGGAILCRETTALALFGLAALFVAGRPLRRSTLGWIAAGVAIVVGGEAMFQWALTGNPLHRWTLAFHHDGHIDRAANLEGNLLVHPAIDPLLVLLVNDDFALLFWLAGAALIAGGTRHLSRNGQARFGVLGAMAAAAFLLVAVLVTKLVLNPRYFMLPACAAAIAVAAWLDAMRPRRRALLLGIAVGANLLMLSVENAHPRWPAEALAQAAASHRQERIFADAETVHRAAYPLRWARSVDVVAGPPPPGGLVVGLAAAMPPGARPVARYPSPPTVLGGALSALRLDAILPGGVRRRLVEPNPAMALWRAPAGIVQAPVRAIASPVASSAARNAASAAASRSSTP